MKKILFASSIVIFSMFALSACGEKEHKQPKKETAVNSSSVLQDVVAGKWRTEQAARDKYRHPVETLKFFGLAPGQTVIEIFPGGGWYTNILAPYVNKTGGTFIAAVFEDSLGERYVASNQRFAEKFADKDLYGEIKMVPFGPTSPALCENCADIVLSFRNVHSWMGKDYGDKAFADFYKALKPGGILGVVEHRLPESAEQDPKASTGYVQTSYVKDMAKRAGFEFVDASEVNANPKDSADHPLGVWTLPPASAKPKEGDPRAEGFDAEKYKAIGESDRFTLKFRKPK